MMAGPVDAFFRYMAMGGPVMPPLVLCTFLLWFGVGFRWSLLRSPREEAPDALLVRAREGRLERPRGPVERAAHVAWDEERRSPRDLRDRVAAATWGLRDEVGRFRNLTGTVVAIAPLLGLLGTVSGMIETFAALGSTGVSNASGIAGGISQALLTTQFGLAVAVPGLIVQGILNRRQRRRENQIDALPELASSWMVGGTP